MAEIVRMPKLSNTMTEGIVAEWHKNIGDQIEIGDLLAEIETDKATMEFEAFQDGVLLHTGVEKGQAAPVGSILAILGAKGEDITSIIEYERKVDLHAKKVLEDFQNSKRIEKSTTLSQNEALKSHNPILINSNDLDEAEFEYSSDIELNEKKSILKNKWTYIILGIVVLSLLFVLFFDEITNFIITAISFIAVLILAWVALHILGLLLRLAGGIGIIFGVITLFTSGFNESLPIFGWSILFIIVGSIINSITGGDYD